MSGKDIMREVTPHPAVISHFKEIVTFKSSGALIVMHVQNDANAHHDTKLLHNSSRSHAPPSVLLLPFCFHHFETGVTRRRFWLRLHHIRQTRDLGNRLSSRP